MSFIQVVGMFDDRESLEQARSALKRMGLADDFSMRAEPDPTVGDSSPTKPPKIWRRLKALLTGESDKDVGAYAEAVRRGSLLLVVTTPQEQAERIRQVLRANGAVELRKRVLRWVRSGWDNFDPAGLAFTEEEITQERRCIANEGDSSDDDGANGDHQTRTIRLYDEATGREIGLISESELRLLQDALEEEDPHDNDYWINSDEIDEIACRPGATRHLISLLRTALVNHPEGIEIAFEREGEPRTNLSARSRAS